MRKLEEIQDMWERAAKVLVEDDSDEVAQAIADTLKWVMYEDTGDWVVTAFLEE